MRARPSGVSPPDATAANGANATVRPSAGAAACWSATVAAAAGPGGDVLAASALCASRRMSSRSGAGFAFAVAASELFPAICLTGCPWSPFVTLVASSAICRNLDTRADALSALLPGGPVSLNWSARVNASVRRCCAACGEIPSCAATDAASEPASCAMTSSIGVPASSFALIVLASVDAAAEDVVVGAEVRPSVAFERAAIESPSWDLNSAASSPAGPLGWASVRAEVDARASTIGTAFKVSPPLLWSIGPRRARPERLLG